MKYILIANNVNILDTEIEKLTIDKDDIIILFNYQYPLKWTKIRDHPNKILFIRMLNWGFLGFSQTKSNHKLYNKIIPYSKNKYPANIIKKNTLNKFGKQILNKIEIINDTMHKLLIDVIKYPQNKDPTMGFIGYNYVKHMIGEDIDIALVGFTLIYNGKLGTGPGHAWDFELNFYKNELEINKHLQKIDAVIPISPEQYIKQATTNNTNNKKPINIKKPIPLKKILIEKEPTKTQITQIKQIKHIDLHMKPQVKNLLKLHLSRIRKR